MYYTGGVASCDGRNVEISVEAESLRLIEEISKRPADHFRLNHIKSFFTGRRLEDM